MVEAGTGTGNQNTSSTGNGNAGTNASTADTPIDFNAVAANCNSNVCFFCQKTFTNVYNCRRHIRTHSGEKAFQCNICGKRFSRQSTLNTHEKIHTGNQLFKCDVCALSFDVYRQLTEHMSVHRIDKPFTCKICNKSYSRATVLSQHMKTHGAEAVNSNPFKCTNCALDFATEAQLKNHETTHTVAETIIPPLITATNITTTTTAAATAAIVVGTTITAIVQEIKPPTLVAMATIEPILYKCYACDETFKSEKECKIHVQTHETTTVTTDFLIGGQPETEFETEEPIVTAMHDDQPMYDGDDDFIELEAAKLDATPMAAIDPQFVCELCGKYFTNDAELRLHGKNHTCAKYKCDVCDKRFTVLSNFNVHQRMHKGEKPHRCFMCGKSFRLAKSLTVHMVLHSESDSFNCEICDRSFGRSGSLKIHMKSHTNVSDMSRPYIELMTSDDVDDEDEQMYDYVDDKPTMCDICGKEFTRSNGNLRTHKCTKYTTNDDDDDDMMENDDDQSTTIDYWNCD